MKTWKKTGHRRRRLLLRGAALLLVASIALSFLPRPSWSQDEGPAGSEARVEQLEQELATAQRTADMAEKHLRNYLFPAYVIIWLALFGYIRYVAKKERELEEQVRDLKERLGRRD